MSLMCPDYQSTPASGTGPDILVVAAVAFELSPFARRIGVEPPALASVLGAHQGRRIALLSTGMGRRGDAAFDAALRDLRPAAILNVGIAGALDLAHPAGSRWLVEEWRRPEQPHGIAATADAALSAEIGAALDRAGLRWRRGRAVMVDEPLHDTDERDRIRDGSGAHLVEMEGAAWAEIARHHGIPFAAVRVVSDHADRPLPGPAPAGDGRRAWLLRDDGRPRKRRMAWALFVSGAWRRPKHHLSEIKAAGGQFREAMKGLEGVADALFPGSPQ
jgi:nucleoside phosphorylase